MQDATVEIDCTVDAQGRCFANGDDVKESCREAPVAEISQVRMSADPN